MITIEKICSGHASFSSLTDLYLSAFPEGERRPLEAIRSMMEQREDFSFQSIKNKEDLVGFITTWDLKDFLFIEHFAIFSHIRGQNMGSKTLMHLLENSPIPILLETEKEISDEAIARIRFYEKLGFRKFPFSYFQPPYRQDEPYIPMYLFSSGENLSELNFSRVTKTIISQVYQI